MEHRQAPAIVGGAGNDALWRLGATALAELLRCRAVSSAEVTEALIERIHAREQAVRAFTAFEPERAMAAARRMDRQPSTDRAFAGLPFGVKDVYDVAGLPTGAGSRLVRTDRADRDAAAVATLEQRGFVLLGKLATNELGAGGFMHDPPVNPWRGDVTTGVSSAGAAAALATGLAPLALGADTGGSARIPAAFCGVVGLRPTAGRISGVGTIPLSPELDEPGPMARTVDDVALLLRALTGERPEPLDLTEGDRRHVTVGIPGAQAMRAVERRVGDAFAAAVATFGDLGFRLREVELPSLDATDAAYRVLAYTGTLRHHGPRIDGRWNALSPRLVRRLAVGACLGERELTAATAAVAIGRRDLTRALDAVDVILTPATPALPDASSVGIRDDNPALIARLASVAGVPAVAFPCGVTSGGLPVGAQLMGRPREELCLLRVARAYERASPWHAMVPIDVPRAGAPRVGDAPDDGIAHAGPEPSPRDAGVIDGRLRAEGIVPTPEVLSAAAGELQLIRHALSRRRGDSHAGT